MKIKSIFSSGFILWALIILSLMFFYCEKDPTPPPDDPMPPADSTVWHFEATLAGEFEVPPVNTPTTGNLKIRINEDSTSFSYMLIINNAIQSLSLGAHLHCGFEGENGNIVIFLIGPTPLGFDGSFEITASRNSSKIINPSCGDSIFEFVKFMQAGNVYVNIHNDTWPGGEIRGQIKPIPVTP